MDQLYLGALYPHGLENRAQLGPIPSSAIVRARVDRFKEFAYRVFENDARVGRRPRPRLRSSRPVDVAGTFAPFEPEYERSDLLRGGAVVYSEGSQPARFRARDESFYSREDRYSRAFAPNT